MPPWLRTVLLFGLPALIFVGPGRLEPATVEVELTGIDGSLRDSVAKQLTLINRSEQDLTKEDIRRLHRRAPDQIRQALEPLGYYQPEIETTLRQEGGTWQAQYEVNPGDPVRTSDVNVKLVGPGRDDDLLRRAVDEFPLEENDVLHHGRYEQGKRRFHELARQQGYLDGEFETSRVLVDRESGEARVELTFQTGNRYRLGEVRLRDGGLDEDLLRSMLFLETGEPFEQERLIEQEEAFSASGYFRRVAAEPDFEASEGQRVPLTIDLAAAQRHSYSVGLGYGTNTGPRLRFNYLNRRVNKRGHRFRLDTLLSPQLIELDSNYTIPLGNPNLRRLDLNVAVSRNDYPHTTSDLARLGPVFVERRGSWRFERSLQFRHEKFEDAERTDTLSFLVPEWSIRRIQLDNPSLPKRGYSLSGRLRGGHEDLGSDANFAQFIGDARYVRQLLWPGFRIHLRGTVGATAVGEVRDLPPTLRFFAGGQDSVRGYEYNDLGAKNDNGDVIGGKHLAVGSVELEQEIVNNWSAAIFFDAGNSLDRFDDFSDQYRRGAGAGIRWQSPVGPFRLDYGIALDKSGNPGRIHFSLGPQF